MSEAEREKWDRRYAEGTYRARTWPSPYLEALLERIPPGRALDVACGTGRNAIRLAEAGFVVDAVDISAEAIARAREKAADAGVEVEWVVADLDELELAASAYDLVSVIRYINRNLWPRLPAALAPNGWLIVEHHLRTGIDVDGPPDPEFRLAPQELLRAFGALRILDFEEVLEVDRDGRRYALERIVACKGDPGF